MQKLSNLFLKNSFQGFKLKHCFTASAQLTQFKIAQTPQKYELNILKSEQMPIILRQQDDLLVKQWWSQRSFEAKKELMVPVFSFKTGEYTGEGIELPQEIFNVPLRRDIVHRVMLWRQNLYYIRTHMARDKATTAGSGKKPTPQKGQGRARRGNKRAPGQKKGGKVHGPKPRLMRYSLNKKVRLQALQIMLSAKLAEGKLRIVDSEVLEQGKTQIVSKIIEQYDQNSRILFIHGYNADKNFLQAVKNIKRVQTCEPNRINILKLLKQERVFITKEGLQQLIQDQKDRIFLKYRVKAVQRTTLESEQQRKDASGEVEQEEARYIYDPTKPLKFKFRILNDYLDQYEKVRKDGKLDDFTIKY